MAEIKVEIIKIKHRKSDSGWGVLLVKEKLPINAVGIIPESTGPGDMVTLTGDMGNSKFGKQFKFSKIEIEAPDVNTEDGVCRLLKKLPTIGEKKAAAAVFAHGHEKAWRLACTDPARIGVPKGRCEEVIKVATLLLSSYEEQVYFLSLGLTQGQINKITEKFGGKKGMKVVKETPYKLLDIDGFGFLTVDSIALRAGVNPGAEGRISACVMYFLNDSTKSGGHTWFYMSKLIHGDDWKGGITGVLTLLKKTAMAASVPLSGMPGDDDIKRAVTGLESEGKVVIIEGKVYDSELLRAEMNIQEALGI